MYTIKNTTGGCGVKGASGAGIAPPGNPGDVLYLVSSGVAGAATDVLYTGDGNLYVSNSVTTTNVFATTANVGTLIVDGSMTANSVNTVFFFDTLTIPFVTTSNLTVSNLFATTGDMNVYGNVITNGYIQAIKYYGDGGLLSNISSSAITQPFANLVVSNSVTTTNIFAMSANIATMNVGYLTVNSAVVYGTSTLNVYGVSNLSTTIVNGSMNVTGNITASNSVTTTNVFATTVSGTNVIGTHYGVLAGSNTVSGSTQTLGGTAGVTTLNVTGNLYASNAVTTTNVFTTNVFATGRIGIGTTSPSSLLDLRGGSISLGSFDTSSASRYVGFYNGNDSNGPLVGMEIENTTLGGNYSQKLHFRTHAFGGNNGRRLTIDEYGNVFVEKNLTTTNPYWFITHSSGGNATYTPGGGSWFSSTASGTFGNSITVGGTASASAFNTTSGTFTFPVAGTYLISVPMFINGATGGRYAIATFASSIKPVSQYFEFTSTNLPANEMRTWTYVKQVNAGDTMYLSTPAGSITLYLAETHSCLIIFKVG